LTNTGAGEGTTTTPGKFTPFFGVIKGQAESALLGLQSTLPSLRIFSLRPGGVDAGYHTEIHRYIPVHQTMLKKVSLAVLLPALRGLAPSMLSPTKDLGRVLTELAMGDGKPLDGPGIDGEGRTISNKAFRGIAGL
jgi:hypothetical protein